MVVLQLKPEEAEKIKTDLVEAVSWFEGFEAGRGSSVPVNIESIRSFTGRINASRHLELVENEQF
jgi:hypothetical protein